VFNFNYSTANGLLQTVFIKNRSCRCDFPVLPVISLHCFPVRGTQAGGVGDFFEIVQTLPDGAEISRSEIFDRFQSPAFGGSQAGVEHPAEKGEFSVIIHQWDMM
jgi:hypothetical protein